MKLEIDIVNCFIREIDEIKEEIEKFHFWSRCDFEFIMSRLSLFTNFPEKDMSKQQLEAKQEVLRKRSRHLRLIKNIQEKAIKWKAMGIQSEILDSAMRLYTNQALERRLPKDVLSS